jgi:hypothetical protein
MYDASSHRTGNLRHTLRGLPHCRHGGIREALLLPLSNGDNGRPDAGSYAKRDAAWQCRRPAAPTLLLHTNGTAWPVRESSRSSRWGMLGNAWQWQWPCLRASLLLVVWQYTRFRELSFYWTVKTSLIGESDGGGTPIAKHQDSARKLLSALPAVRVGWGKTDYILTTAPRCRPHQSGSPFCSRAQLS